MAQDVRLAEGDAVIRGRPDVGVGEGGDDGDHHQDAVLVVRGGGAGRVSGRRDGADQADGATPPKADRPTSFAEFVQNLTKSKKDVWIGGVCGGLGEHTPIPSWVWCALFAVMIFGYGVGLAAYIVLWIFVPEAIRERPVTEVIASPSSQSK